MDDDGNKKISMEEFRKGMADYGLQYSKDDVNELFKKIDSDHDGTISFDEFLLKLRVIFETFKNYSNFILVALIPFFNIRAYCSLKN